MCFQRNYTSKLVNFGILLHILSWQQQKHQCLCFHCWDYLTNFWHNNWQSITDIIERHGLCEFCLKLRITKVSFSVQYTWQHFGLWGLRLVQRLYMVIHPRKRKFCLVSKINISTMFIDSWKILEMTAMNSYVKINNGPNPFIF